MSEELNNLAIDALNELSTYFIEKNEQQPGDLLVKDVAEYFGYSETHARRKMKEAVKDGKFEEICIVHPEIKGRSLLAYRPVLNKKTGE